MANMNNRVTLVGNLGADPKVWSTESDRVKISFSIAINKSYRDSKTGEWKTTDPDWFNVVFWGRKEEVAEAQIKRGDRVIVVGELRRRLYNYYDTGNEGEDENKEKKYITEVVGDIVGKVKNLFHRKERERREGDPYRKQEGSESTSEFKEQEEDDHLPF